MIKQFKLTMQIGALLIMSIIAPKNIFSKTIDSVQAQKIGINFLNSKYKNSLSNINPKDDSNYYIVNINTKCYIINDKIDASFVIIAGTDNVQPILAYSYESNLDTSSIPPAFKKWLNWKISEIKYAIDDNIEANNSVKVKWNNLLNGGYDYIQKKLIIAPLITTKWGQGNHYNDLCPVDSNSIYSNHRVPTGCGATAMAQLLKYWNYPSSGIGKNLYQSNYGELSADFANTTYNWSNMPNVLTKANIDVATLMYQCGISVNMDYAPDGSGSNPSDVYQALINVFNYKYATDNEDCIYDYEFLDAVIKSDLLLKRPVLLTGNDIDLDPGHYFIADGYESVFDNQNYDSTFYFHINWGWDGMCNGYFQLDSLIPYTGYDFSYDLIYVNNLYPPLTSVNSTIIKNNELIISPNPNNGNFAINNLNCFGEIKILINDINGNLVYSNWLNIINNLINIDLNLPSGVYNLILSNNNKNNYLKLLIEK